MHFMTLKVIVPFDIVFEKKIVRLVVETTKGSRGVLPLRLDCTALLVPGIVTYECQGEGEKYLVIDEGIFVKTGSDVTLSVRRALIGTQLGDLEKELEGELNKKREREKYARQMYTALEKTFLRQIAGLLHE